MNSLKQNLEKVISLGIESLFKKIHRGIEKESLRVKPNGALADTTHPKALGSALTHPSITTDYCEAQLEFVSPVSTDIDTLTNFLTDAHHYTYQNIGNEKLWVNSMPCIIRKEKDIPIARFGTSNVGKMKEIYREGLGHRYGRLMQTISGIHYNFSLPKEFWPHYLGKTNQADLTDAISDEYLKLIRNFHRHTWLLFYLFGASPSVCKTFLQGQDHELDDFEGNSFYAPYATSLRMSDIGYSNDAQDGIKVCYNDLENFTDSLLKAMNTSHSDYEKIGVKVDGEYQQLNTNLLQIENEFYASIRPKRVAKTGERASTALIERGIEYVEVRCIDLNPYVPIGIDQETIVFLDMFLLYCLFEASPDMTTEDMQRCKSNNNLAIMRGREPDLTLDENGKDTPLKNWAEKIIDNMHPIAEILDSIHFSDRYTHVLSLQVEKIKDAHKTPSGKILDDVMNEHSSFFDFAQYQAKRHESFFKHLVQNNESKTQFEQQAHDSLLKQTDIEQKDSLTFDEYLAAYFE
ncbi:MAG: glutamate--cysteine ligase [Arenicellales bacterium]